METKIPRIVIAATQSGAGKTTIVAGLLAALRARGIKAQPYKVGPDYIDPGYHRLASGRAAHNLDTWLVSEEKLADLFASTAQSADIAVIEGVMGLYDGGKNGVSSTAEIAKHLGAPVLLVVDAKSMGDSAAALALGFKLYDRDVNLAGVILNRLGSDSHEEMIKSALKRLGIEVYGALRRDETLHLPQRHLGLVPTEENDAALTVQRIGQSVAAQVDIDPLLTLAKTAAPVHGSFFSALPKGKSVCVALANDEAFSFYYPESIAVLEAMGAKIAPFSPLHDARLPKGCAGIFLGGGFPEMFAAKLSANEAMRRALLEAIGQGLPVYAECGGLMYLTRRIRGFGGESYPMVGAVPAVCNMEKKLQTVGYIEAEALRDNLLCRAGEKLRGHEFHFSTLEPEEQGNFPWAFRFEKKRVRKIYPSGFAKGNLLASYLHIHFAGNVGAAERFLNVCRAYGEQAHG